MFKNVHKNARVEARLLLTAQQTDALQLNIVKICQTLF